MIAGCDSREGSVGVWHRGRGTLLSHRMYFLIVLNKSTTPQNVNLLFTITNQNIKLAIVLGS